jgi:sugar O-acyltransferase (sialic acid O-acetyltransferase NeuD family)
VPTDILLVGGGGHCISCIDVIESTRQYSIVGVLDPKGPNSPRVAGYPVIGSDDDAASLLPSSRLALITVGQMASALTRKNVFARMAAAGAVFPVIVASTAYCSPHCEVGEGTIVMHRAVVNAAAKIGVNCIINSACLLEHGAVVGSHCHISTAAIVNGDCVIGDEVFIGSNATLFNGVKVASGAAIGGGSVVTRSITEPGTYVGNPARRIR